MRAELTLEMGGAEGAGSQLTAPAVTLGSHMSWPPL
jgi:hypothetical protein